MRQYRPARQAAGHPGVNSTPAAAVLAGEVGGLVPTETQGPCLRLQPDCRGSFPAGRTLMLLPVNSMVVGTHLQIIKQVNLPRAAGLCDSELPTNVVVKLPADGQCLRCAAPTTWSRFWKWCESKSDLSEHALQTTNLETSLRFGTLKFWMIDRNNCDWRLYNVTSNNVQPFANSVLFEVSWSDARCTVRTSIQISQCRQNSFARTVTIARICDTLLRYSGIRGSRVCRNSNDPILTLKAEVPGEI